MITKPWKCEWIEKKNYTENNNNNQKKYSEAWKQQFLRVAARAFLSFQNVIVSHFK